MKPVWIYLLEFLVIFGFDAVFSKPIWEINAHLCPTALCGLAPIVESRPTGFLGALIKPRVKPYPFFEGDIVLDTPFSYNSGRQKRSVAKAEKLWKHGIVPYELDELRLGYKAKRAIKQALRYIERKTCIKFKKKTNNDKNYIKYSNLGGCWSRVGMKGGMQLLSVGIGCEKLGVVLHETGHALGFWHEQSRPDRDKYVKIIWKNISKRYLNQFGKRPLSETESRGYAYDYRSVMHYGDRDFSLSAKKTIRVEGPGKELKLRIGQRKRLSPLDIAQLRDMYGCNKGHTHIKSCVKTRYRDGRDYRGRLDYTRNGVTCQYWSDQYPHKHNWMTGIPTRDQRYGLGRHNYCRNPGGLRSRPWCFTTLEKSEWQYCDVKIC